MVNFTITKTSASLGHFFSLFRYFRMLKKHTKFTAKYYAKKTGPTIIAHFVHFA